MASIGDALITINIEAREALERLRVVRRELEALEEARRPRRDPMPYVLAFGAWVVALVAVVVR